MDAAHSLEMISPTPSEYVQNAKRPSAEAREVFSRFRDLELSAYLERTKYATDVLFLIKEQGGTIVNDHIALRSFKDEGGTGGLEVLEPLFLSYGYQKEEPIYINALCLECCWYEPPEDSNWPKVFISEQQVDQLPEAARKLIWGTIKNYYSSKPLSTLGLAKPEKADPQALYEVLENPPWNPSSTDYQALLDMAEEDGEFRSALQYAAWTLVHAHRWNHFTVLINRSGLEASKSLESFNAWVEGNGFPLNQWNGNQIQGSEDKHLKQSSTVANLVSHRFADGVTQEVPGSFVEFIERFMVNSDPFRGFIAGNARGIFASTDANR